MRSAPFVAAFVAGATSLALELVLVRMLAFFLATSLDFLAIPLALLGLALGSMATHLFWKGPLERLTSLTAQVLLPVVVTSFFVFFFTFDQWFFQVHAGEIHPSRDVPWLVISSGILLPPFVVFGAFFASLFASHPERIGRLYAADLAGAAAGCVVAPVLLTLTDLPQTILGLTCGAFLLGQVGPRTLVARLAPAGLLAAVVVGVWSGRLFVEHPNPQVLARSVTDNDHTPVTPGPVRWNELARAQVMRVGDPGKSELFVVQDSGLSNVRLYPYRPGHTIAEGQNREHGLAWRMGRDPHRILVLFAGAGRDMIVFDAFAEGRATITGVELNPAVLSLALLPGYTSLGIGPFLARDGIDLRIREGRDFLNQDTATYDLVYVANNGAVFANRTGHTRKFLDTSEAMAAYLDRLAPGGLIVFANQPVGEKVRSFLDLLPARGHPDPRGAMFAYGWPDVPEIVTLVVAPDGLTAAEIGKLTAEVDASTDHKVVLYAPGQPDGERRLAAIEEGFGEHRPVTDDRPFARSLQLGRLTFFPSAATLHDLAWMSSWIKVVTVVLFACVSAVVAFGAWWFGGPKVRVPGAWAFYLLLTGVGYMCVEIGLVARTELVIGNPLYAVAVNLAVFLVFNAVGSALQDRAGGRTTPVVLATLAVLGVAWGIGATALLARFALSSPLVVKAALVAVAVAPPGIALGRFYPFAVERLVRTGRGAAVPATYGLTTLSSVLGSSLATALMIEVGFVRVIMLGAAAYVAACAVAIGAGARQG